MCMELSIIPHRRWVDGSQRNLRLSTLPTITWKCCSNAGKVLVHAMRREARSTHLKHQAIFLSWEKVSKTTTPTLIWTLRDNCAWITNHNSRASTMNIIQAARSWWWCSHPSKYLMDKLHPNVVMGFPLLMVKQVSIPTERTMICFNWNDTINRQTKGIIVLLYNSNQTFQWFKKMQQLHFFRGRIQLHCSKTSTKLLN